MWGVGVQGTPFLRCNSVCQALWLQPAGLASHPPACSICRCGCITMLKSPNKTTAVKQWEQRWIKNCLCGGLWWRMPLSYP